MQIKPLVILLSLGIAGVSLQAQAGTDWYVSPSVSYVINDDHRAKNDGWGVGLAVGKAINDAWNVEFGGRYLQLDGKKDEMGSVGLDALRFFNRNPAFAPYVVMGLGYVKEGGSNNNLMGNVGAGFFRQLSKSVDLRADVRYHLHDNRKEAMESGNLGDWLISLGVNYSMGK